MRNFSRKSFSVVFGLMLAIVMLFGSVAGFAETNDTMYPIKDVEFAKTRANVFLESVGRSVNVKDGILLENIDGGYEAIAFSMPGNGYIIVNLKDLTIPELSFESPNPYLKIENPVYNGALGYYSRRGDAFISVKDNVSFDINQFSEIYSKSEIANKNDLVQSLEYSSQNQLRHVNIEQYITGSLKTWYISGGHCGSIAGAICMRYYYDYVDTDYVPSNSTSQDDLIALMQQHVGSGGTNYTDMVDGLNDYLGTRAVNNSASRTNSFSFSRVKTQVNNSRPIIIGTSNHPVYGNHWIVGHGYFTSPVDGDYVIVNNGWGDNNVWIEPSTTYLDGTIYFDN